MSNTKKKTYKKRKQAAHTTAKTHVNVKPEDKVTKFLNDWLWLITLVVMVAAVALFVIFIPMCDDSCATCTESCTTACENIGKDDEVSASDPIDPAEHTDQMNMPKDGEEIAVIETSMGTIKMRLFPENAPKSVENFKGLINSGYYDSKIFHRVVKGFVIQGATGTDGSSGPSIWGGAFEDEFENGLFHFRGAVSMANTMVANSNTSQFFIVQADSVNIGAAELAAVGLPEWAAQYYQQVGGTPTLDREVGKNVGYLGHTVFAQVFEGMDVVDAIAAVETDTQTERPIDDVVIIKASIEVYHDHPVEG